MDVVEEADASKDQQVDGNETCMTKKSIFKVIQTTPIDKTTKAFSITGTYQLILTLAIQLMKNGLLSVR